MSGRHFAFLILHFSYSIVEFDGNLATTSVRGQGSVEQPREGSRHEQCFAQGAERRRILSAGDGDRPTMSRGRDVPDVSTAGLPHMSAVMSLVSGILSHGLWE